MHKSEDHSLLCWMEVFKRYVQQTLKHLNIQAECCLCGALMILADLEVDSHLLMENNIILFENTIILNICYTVCTFGTSQSRLLTDNLLFMNFFTKKKSNLFQAVL